MAQANFPVCEDPQSIHALLDDAVARLSWVFPTVSSGNTQMGFRLRQGKLRAELKAYSELFLIWSGRLPSLDHLLAAGSLLRSKPGFANNLSSRDILYTTEHTFEEIWSDVSYALRALPHVDIDEIDPFKRPRKPRRRAKDGRVIVRRSKHEREIFEVSLASDLTAKLEDLVGFYGGHSALQKAISLLWRHTALRKDFRHNLEDWPSDPAEAWARIRDQSKRVVKGAKKS